MWACAQASDTPLVRVNAMPLTEYRARVQQATKSLDELAATYVDANKDESDGEAEPAAEVKSTSESSGDKPDAPELVATRAELLRRVRASLPVSEKVEWAGGAVEVDNNWLLRALDDYEQKRGANKSATYNTLARLGESLRALDERLATAEAATTRAGDKEGEKARLATILRRPEYHAQDAARESALRRLWRRFTDWLDGLLPKPRNVSSTAADRFSFIARLFVYALALAALGFVLWRYGGHLLRRGGELKVTPERKARVVLGERLAAGQSSADLLTEAEALACAGDWRGAVRKAYLAVLCELGDRQVLRLAAHKTNLDYLRAVRELGTPTAARLYGDLQPLVANYERHWYGLTAATDADWQTFRARCRAALRGE